MLQNLIGGPDWVYLLREAFIEAHGGIIWAENSVHLQGAVFLITLPLANNVDDNKNVNENDNL